MHDVHFLLVVFILSASGNIINIHKIFLDFLTLIKSNVRNVYDRK